MTAFMNNAWWIIPLFITIAVFGWWAFRPNQSIGLGDAIASLILLIPVTLISALAWMLGAVFK